MNQDNLIIKQNLYKNASHTNHPLSANYRLKRFLQTLKTITKLTPPIPILIARWMRHNLLWAQSGWGFFIISQFYFYVIYLSLLDYKNIQKLN